MEQELRISYSEKALGELVRQSRVQSEQLTLLARHNKRMVGAFWQYAIIGAMLASFVAAIWAFTYLITISASFAPLLDYVTGRTFGSQVFQSTESLFVILARFLLAFGLTWMPLTLLVGLIDFLRLSLLRLLAKN